MVVWCPFSNHCIFAFSLNFIPLSSSSSTISARDLNETNLYKIIVDVFGDVNSKCIAFSEIFVGISDEFAPVNLFRLKNEFNLQTSKAVSKMIHYL